MQQTPKSQIHTPYTRRKKSLHLSHPATEESSFQLIVCLLAEVLNSVDEAQYQYSMSVTGSVTQHDPSSLFESSKKQVLHDIQTGIDSSPKGSIDVPIRDLVAILNDIEGLVTTSSCSGRISIFRNDTSPGAKGINWLLVKHSVISVSDIVQTCSGAEVVDNDMLTLLKCEGMILHVMCKDIQAARELHGELFLFSYNNK